MLTAYVVTDDYLMPFIDQQILLISVIYNKRLFRDASAPGHALSDTDIMREATCVDC